MILREWITFDASKYAIQILMVVFHDYKYVFKFILAIFAFLGGNDYVNELGSKKIVLHVR